MDGRQESAGFVVSELKTMHLTYLNCAHDRKVLDYWKQISWSTEGVWKEHSLYDYVGSHLGYRLIVRSVEMKVCFCGKWEMELEIENTGFAAPFQEMELFLVLEGGAPVPETAKKKGWAAHPVRKWKKSRPPFAWQPADERQVTLSNCQGSNRNSVFLF